MLDRLKMDPGTRTLGELLQERQWAVQEIERMRGEFQTWKDVAERPAVNPNVHGVPTPSKTDSLRAMPERLLRLTDVCHLSGLSRSSIYTLQGEERFPQAVRVGIRAVRWRAGDVVAWLESRRSSARKEALSLEPKARPRSDNPLLHPRGAKRK